MLLSIITINLNNSTGLRKTLESVTRQTYTDFEYIVIDGGSTDGSVDVIKQFDHQIGHWITEKDNGIYDAMNKAIALTHGTYIYFLNGGDLFHDQTVLHDLMTTIRENDFPDIVFGNVCFKNNDHEVVQNRQHCDVVDVFYKPVNHQTIFASKRSLIDKFDIRLKILADYNWFMSQLTKRDIRILYVNRSICYYDTTGLSAKSLGLLNTELNAVRRKYFHKGYAWLLSHIKGTRFMHLLKASPIKRFLSMNILKKKIGRALISNV